MSLWASRNRVIAEFILPGEVVLDIGAGEKTLRKELPRGCVYVPVDLPDFDMDGEWPIIEADVVVMSGSLEYARDPGAVLEKMRRVAPRALVTYVHGGRRLRDPDWKNSLSVAWFIELAVKAGWRDVRHVADWRVPLIRKQRVWELR